MRNFLTNFPFTALGVFVTIVGSFTYSILLDRDMHCTCKDVGLDCSTYILLPFLIIFLLILWIDKTLQKTCNYTCQWKFERKTIELPKNCYYCCCSLLKCYCCCSVIKRCWSEIKRCWSVIKSGCQCLVIKCDCCCCCSVTICRTQLCGVFLKHSFRALCVGLLWVVSVLVDGDWYVCCSTGSVQSQLACKNKTNITAEENVTIDSLKNRSRVSVSFFFL